MTSRTSAAQIAVVLSLTVLVSGCAGMDHNHLAAKQATVRMHGQQVMPFRLDRTTHVFSKTRTGGIESVVAKTAADQAQIPLIRQHLRKEQRLFSRGDFRDPMATHGMHMPGIDMMRRNAASITIAYQDTARGGQLRYTTVEPRLQDALHQWFDAQLMDHGSDAMP